MTTMTQHPEQLTRREIPRRQIVLILVGFPALYMINSFMPWSRQLFGANDHEAWFTFWASASILSWTSVAAAAFVMRRNGWKLSDVGISLARPQRVAMAAAAVSVGLGAVAIRATYGRLEALGIAHLVGMWSAQAKPWNVHERVLWVVLGVISAAFCEEFVYRGFGFHAMRSRGVRLAGAAVLASLAWIGVHGLGGVFGFPFYAVFAAALTGLVLRTRSLMPSLIVHSLIHVFVILGS